MGLSNLRAFEHSKRRRGAKKAGCPILSPHSEGWTKHARQSAERREIPLSDVPVSLRVLNGMIKSGGAKVREAKGKAKKVIFFAKGVKYEIIADLEWKRVKKRGIITIYRLDN
ncbi:MAG: hypothetical protein PHQ42_03510 [Patescibacteria group bacterium]|nr:hypothetical protein [Patescibacteria group bacterium]